MLKLILIVLKKSLRLIKFEGFNNLSDNTEHDKHLR